MVFIIDMARDTFVGRERVLIIPSSISLEGDTSQTSVVPNDINHQIMEVS